ncbi:MAG: hypothetical protein K2W82_05385 [Candidatus Obscuribacterales bacterium]|nr:hypothetical protein [Candidatus Obscuribacterales bacterium]
MNMAFLKPRSATLMIAGLLCIGSSPAFAQQNQANEAIQSEVKSLTRQTQNQANQLIDKDSKEYNSTIKRTEQDTQRDADNCSVWDGWRQKNFINDQGKAKETALKQAEEKNAQADIDSMRQRSETLQDSAKNLQSLINEKPSDPGVHVNPEGTNLYIRNYK